MGQILPFYTKQIEEDIEIINFLDLENQKIYERSYKCVFIPQEKTEEYLLRHKEWTHKYVEYTLGDSYKKTKMNVLQIGNITCYRPIEMVKNADFERFFGYGLLSGNKYSTNIIRFSYGTNLLVPEDSDIEIKACESFFGLSSTLVV